MNEITDQEAVEFIRKWGIDPDDFISHNFKQFMSGDIADDNSIELARYHQKRLEKVVDIAINSKPLTVERVLAALEQTGRLVVLSISNGGEGGINDFYDDKTIVCGTDISWLYKWVEQVEKEQ